MQELELVAISAGKGLSLSPSLQYLTAFDPRYPLFSTHFLCVYFYVFNPSYLFSSFRIIIRDLTHPLHHDTKSPGCGVALHDGSPPCGRHPFFIMEEDWRLTRSDGFGRGELLERQRVRGERIVSLSPETPPPPSRSIVCAVQAAHEAALRDDYRRITSTTTSQPLPGRQGAGQASRPRTREVQGWALATQKPRPEEFENTSPFLKQLIRLVTAAHRRQRGNLVWLSWNGTEGRSKNPLPQHATTLLALSCKGARLLQQRFWSDITRSHFDISLKWVCENFAPELEASFVLPTIGHYSTHDSDILSMERTAEWNRWYVGEGRGWVEVMSWEKRANRIVAQRLFDYDLENEEQVEFDWLTFYRESQRPERAPEGFAQPSTWPPPSQSDASRQRTQEEMEHAFDTERMVGDEEASTKRQKRQQRRYKRDSANRIFTGDILKAC